MPLQSRQSDYTLNGKQFMLERAGPWKGRAWNRSGAISVPGFETTRSEEGTSRFPQQIEFSEVWDDWSGGFGYAYRTPEHANTYHWGENVDARWPNQLVHCQRILPVGRAYTAIGGQNGTSPAEFILDTPPFATVSLPAGYGALLRVGRAVVSTLEPDTAGSFNAWSNLAVGDGNTGYRPALFGSWWFVPHVTGTGFARIDIRPDMAATIMSGATLPAKVFAVAGNRMWRAHGPNFKSIYLQSIADANGALSPPQWSATLSIGNGQIEINDMIALDSQLFLGMANGLYAGDQSGTFINVTGDLGNQSNPENFRDLCVFNGGVVGGHVTGLYRYRNLNNYGEVAEIGPPVTSNRSPVVGRFRTVTPLGQWLYAGLWTGSQSWLCAGRETDNNVFQWHTQQRIPLLGSVPAFRIHRMHFDGVSVASSGQPVPNRMWLIPDMSLPSGVIATLSDPAIYEFPIPQNHGNPLVSDPSFSANYVGSFRLDLGAIDRGAPGALKFARRFEVWADNFASGAQYADVYYTVDHGVRTLLGRAQQSPVSYLYFPSTQGSFTTFRQIEMSVESFTASANTTPAYRSLVLRGAILAEVVDVINAQTQAGDNVVDRLGKRMRPGSVMLTELRQLASPSFGPVQLIDLAGATQIVKVLPPVEESEVWQDGDNNPQVSAGVKLAVLSYTSG